MDELIPFGSHEYCVLLALAAFARGMDFLSTWVATPNLVLEGNPVAKRLGWRWGLVLNVFICLGVALHPVLAVAISTTSVLVAARNFQSAWLMRTMGEEFYRDWHVNRIREARLDVYLLCLAGNTLLSAAVGFALLYFGAPLLVPSAVGMGVIAYAVAVAFYSSLAFWRIRRSGRRRFRRDRLMERPFDDGFLPHDLASEDTSDPH